MPSPGTGSNNSKRKAASRGAGRPRKGRPPRRACSTTARSARSSVSRSRSSASRSHRGPEPPHRLSDRRHRIGPQARFRHRRVSDPGLPAALGRELLPARPTSTRYAPASVWASSHSRSSPWPRSRARRARYSAPKVVRDARRLRGRRGRLGSRRDRRSRHRLCTAQRAGPRRAHRHRHVDHGSRRLGSRHVLAQERRAATPRWRPRERAPHTVPHRESGSRR